MTADPPTPNPFHPEAGRPPVTLASREEGLRFLRNRAAEIGTAPVCVRVTGVRGMGKTVLLKAFVVEAEADRWTTVYTELYRHWYTEALLTAELAETATQRVLALSRVANLRARLAGAAIAVARTVTITPADSPVTLGIDPSLLSRGANLSRSLGELVSESRAAETKGAILIIDEAQNLADDEDEGEYPMSMLIATVLRLQLEGLPLGLILCGPPSLDQSIGLARPQSERLIRGLPIGPLSDRACAEAFTGPLKGQRIAADPALVEVVVGEVKNYPHFVQLWGAELWSAAERRGLELMTAGLLADIHPDIDHRVETDIYDFRMRRLEVSQRDFLLSLADCPYPPLTARAVAGALKCSEEDVGRMLDDLAREGVLWDPADRGEFVYTVPGFDGYLIAKGDQWRPMRPGSDDTGSATAIADRVQRTASRRARRK